MVYGAILAGGIGKRIERHSIPKQFITIGGTPIIVMTVRTFLKNERFEKIYLAVHKDWIDYAKELLNSSFSTEEIDKLIIVEGGKERLDSFENIMKDIISKNGLNDNDVLICHDSVRPFVKNQMLDDCIDYTLSDKCALTVVPVVDTIHVSNEANYIDGALDRSNLYNGQTPSGFNVKLLKESLDKISGEDRKKYTGTTQILLEQGHKIRIVNGHTSNFKITTDNDLDIAERIVRAEYDANDIELLDCTLRDGGIVINFDFGDKKMQEIKKCLEDSEVEYIECGYIDEKKGSPEGRTCFDSEKSIEKSLLYSGKKPGVTYVAMIDYGTFDVNNLSDATPEGIDGIRLAFHKEHWKDAIELGKIIIKKGYQLFVQPMVSMRYTDSEYRELINICNKELPEAKAFYIVDSFGQMDDLSLLKKLEIADQYVSPDMKIGFHAHNNRQMAFSNACAFAKYHAKHTLMLDSSIMGMGKGAGNLCTELIAPILISKGKSYNTIGIYDEISNYFSKAIKETPWGYSLDYYLSSLYSCTPSYIKIFTGDSRVTTDILIDLLKNMPDEKRAACDRAFAAAYLDEYFTKA